MPGSPPYQYPILGINLVVVFSPVLLMRHWHTNSGLGRKGRGREEIKGGGRQRKKREREGGRGWGEVGERERNNLIFSFKSSSLPLSHTLPSLYFPLFFFP